jgi:methionine-rich copper-binding protein CopC
VRWVRRVALLVAALVLVVQAAGAPAAHADDFLESSDPAPRQETQRAPGWVTLVFATDANASLARILVVDSAGQDVTTGPLIVEGSNVTTQLKTGLTKGTYTVLYRTGDRDGNRRGGSFQFAYGKGEWTPVEKETWIGEDEEPPILKDPDPTEEPTPSPSASPSASPSEEPSGPETYTPAPSATPSASPAPATGGTSWPWLLGGLLALVAAVGVGVAAIQRRRAG